MDERFFPLFDWGKTNTWKVLWKKYLQGGFSYVFVVHLFSPQKLTEFVLSNYLMNYLENWPLEIERLLYSVIIMSLSIFVLDTPHVKLMQKSSDDKRSSLLNNLGMFAEHSTEKKALNAKTRNRNITSKTHIINFSGI